MKTKIKKLSYLRFPLEEQELDELVNKLNEIIDYLQDLESKNSTKVERRKISPSVFVDCTKCEGTGLIKANNAWCDNCNGTGKVDSGSVDTVKPTLGLKNPSHNSQSKNISEVKGDESATNKNTPVKDIDVPDKYEELLVDWLVNVFNNEIKKVIFNCLPQGIPNIKDLSEWGRGFREYDRQFKFNLKEKYGIKLD